MTEQFTIWLPLRSLCVGGLPQCGRCSAVYAFRDLRTSETLKFGETEKLRTRIFVNYIGGFGSSKPDATTKRIHRDLFENGMIDYVEVAWIETSDKAEARRLEKQFRHDYMAAHDGRRPIWDRQN